MIARIVGVALGLGLLAVVAFVASALGSLDRSRAHRARTGALPFLSDGVDDGLVQIRANGMVFRARVAGLDATGPALILLHGFPETSAMWTPLIAAAAGRGYRVVAFDQRGYSPGARPDDVEAYTVDELVADVLAVADAAGFEQFHLVGHDWGCVVGWALVVRHPGRVLTWTGLSIPHPGPLAAQLRRAPPAYIRVFRLPWLPEMMFSFGGMALLRWGTGVDADEDLREEYVSVFSEPGALTAALDWYRSIPRSLETMGRGPFEVRTPTLFIWGNREGWVRGDRLAQQRELVHARYAELELEAGHWLMRERTDQVVAAILDHLAAGSGS